jgi:hypothetical protein
MQRVLRAVVVFVILVTVAAIAAVAVYFVKRGEEKTSLNAADCKGLVAANVLAAGVSTASNQNNKGYCTLDTLWTVDNINKTWENTVAILPVANGGATESACAAACDSTPLCQAFKYDNGTCDMIVSGSDPLVVFSTANENTSKSNTEVTALKLSVPFLDTPPQCQSVVDSAGAAVPFYQAGSIPDNMCGIAGFGPSAPPTSTPLDSKSGLDYNGCAEECSQDPACVLATLTEVSSTCRTYGGAKPTSYTLDSGDLGVSVFYKT